MEGVKIVYQRRSPKQLLRRRNLRTTSPLPIKDQSSKLFRIQVNTPTFYRPSIPPSINVSPVRTVDSSSKPKRKRISYLPNSSVYKKLNVRLTLHNIEFSQTNYTESRIGTRSQMRKTIDFTTQKQNYASLSPLEARGCSINVVSVG
jgi:hypothetical protein